MLINIADDLIRLDRAGLLKELLVDKTLSNLKDGAGKKVKRNIVWATNAYIPRGEAYGASMEIRAGLLSKDHFRVVQTRARKAFEEQSERTKKHAEVFTPLFICKKMNDVADESWTEEILSKRWKKYVDARRLEITCGEGPFLVSRYDAATGEVIPVEERSGILDRKLAVITRFAADEKEWVNQSFRALQATYGYEFQGDNLLIARVNVFADWSEWLEHVWHREPTQAEKKKAINIIAWNLWQMDGLTGKIPNTAKFMEIEEINLFETEEEKKSEELPDCIIYDWTNIKQSLKFVKLAERGKGIMKFDFVIGNPPYQDETIGDNKTFAPPIYNKFMDESYKVGNQVELIHPARFLFNAGNTPKQWNRKMLSDPHFKVLYYERASKKIFPNTDIKGGIAITLHDENRNFGALEIFTPYPELNSTIGKVKRFGKFKSFSEIIVTSYAYHLLDKAYEDNPSLRGRLSNGHENDFKSNILEKLPELFFDTKPEDGKSYIQILGRINNNRIFKYIKRDYVNDVVNLDKYKIFIPGANGTGKLGEPLSSPILSEPGVGSTETFMSIGSFATKIEAENALRYIKSKFARFLLSTKKVTQAMTPGKWEFVPLQDFTSHSDIDWTQSISNIDKQLYAKYGLDEKEISFIESHVKEMA